VVLRGKCNGAKRDTEATGVRHGDAPGAVGEHCLVVEAVPEGAVEAREERMPA